MITFLANLASRRPRLVLAAWLLLTVASLPFASRVGEVLTAQPESPASGVGRAVELLVEEEFALPESETLVAVVRPLEAVPDDFPSAAHDVKLDALRLDLLDVQGVAFVQDYRNAAGLDLVSEEGRFSVVLIGLEPTNMAASKETVAGVRAAFAKQPALSYDLSGGAATVIELEQVSQRDARRAEVYGLPISLLILIVAFGALLAAGLPLLSAVTTIVVSSAALFFVGQVIEFAVFTRTVVTMLGLATGIDYALLMVSRFREELRASGDSREAARLTTLGAGRAVAFSGLTVMVALLALLVPPVAFIRSIGVGTMVVLSVSVLVALTAVPAMLALLGRRINWLRIGKREPGLRSSAFWRARAEQILRRPLLWTVLGTAFLVILALPTLRMQVADPGPRGLSQATEARRVIGALADLGLEGVLSPFDVVVDFGAEGFFHPASVRKISLAERALEGLADVQTVTSPLALDTVPRLFLYQYYASQELAMSSEVAPLVRATVSENGRYVLIRVVPTGSLTPARGGELHGAILASLGELEVDALVGGGYVRSLESTAAIYSSFPLALGLVALATAVLLGLAFKSVLIPLKAVVLNLLTVGAAFGVLVLVLQDGVLAGLLGTGPVLGYIDANAPLFIFAIVFGLSMDYEVFLVARIREAHERGLNDHDAVASAMGATGGVITSAAAVMVTLFVLLLFSQVELIRALGIGLSVAIVLDATLVRMILVPAMMTLAGRWNWWLPGFLRGRRPPPG
ncbi:MAG TPA: MMPL family transporter [Trueperaceae bacterium]|nr:MMPL family transporter [Trueperaceae bacterium]